MQDLKTSRSSAPEPAERSTGPAPDDATRVLAEGPPPSPVSSDRSNLVGQRFGRYTMLEQLDAGGMGVVYSAYDPSLDRKVAIKVLHGERADAEDQSRLWREAQALARLSHPNVVKVHEVGRSEDGAVFVAMEFVRGQSLARWQHTQPGARVVLAAYVQAGRGLAAAHAAGLVHRDFKPHNVMRTADGGVKVLDFGLARASDDSSLDTVTADPSSLSASLTVEGTVMGTPLYMSPEQHEGREVDARTDQYGFCVSLWEGLTGGRPFAGVDLRALYEAKLEGPPPWPARAPSLPRSLVKALRRGLAADPTLRWRSMDALLEALQWEPKRRRRRVMMGLAGLVVVGLGTVSAVDYVKARAERCSGARALLDGVWDEARRSEARAAVLAVGRPYAAEVWTRTERALDEHAQAWVAMHTEACEATTVRHEQSELLLDLRMACLHRAAVDLRVTVDTLIDADAMVVDKAHELVARLRPLSRCADTEALEAEVEPPLPAEAEAVDRAREHLARAQSENVAGRYEAAQQAVDAAKAVLVAVEYGPAHAERALEEGSALAMLGRYDDSVKAYAEALELAVRWSLREQAALAASQMMLLVGGGLLRTDDALEIWPVVRGLSWSDPQRMADARGSLAQVFLYRGKYEEAGAEQRLVLAAQEKALGPDHPKVAASRSVLAQALLSQGKYEEAEAELRLAMTSREKALGPDHPEVAATRGYLAVTLERQGKYEEAEAEQRLSITSKEKALGPDHPAVATSRVNLATVLSSQGKHEEAEAELRHAITSNEKALGANHPDVATYRSNLASFLELQGKYGEAEAELRSALASLVEALGPDHPTVAVARGTLANILTNQGKYEDAEAERRSAQASLVEALGPDHPKVAVSRSNLAVLLHLQGRHEESEAEHRLALAAKEKAFGSNHPTVATSRSHLGSVFDAQGKHAEAEVEHRLALALREKLLGPDHPDVGESRSNLAKVLLEQGRAAEALPLAEQAWERLQRDDIEPETRARPAFVLARVLWSIEGPERDRARARVLAEEAASSLRASEGEVAKALAEVEEWQREHPPR